MGGKKGRKRGEKEEKRGEKEKRKKKQKDKKMVWYGGPKREMNKKR